MASIIIIILVLNFTLTKITIPFIKEENVKPFQIEANSNNENVLNSLFPFEIVKAHIFALISVGTPKQTFKLLIDTGSNILWVTSNKCISCKSANKFSSTSETFTNLNEPDTINYVTGDCTGTYATDQISFDTSNPIKLKILLVSNHNQKLDGIVGLGYSISHLETSIIDKFFVDKIIDKNMFSIKYSSEKKGEITIGDYSD